MARSEARIVLATRSGDRSWFSRCENALRARGIEIINAYDCWSAELAQALHGGEAFVLDARVLCGSLSADRPGPVLVTSPKPPVVVFNAQELDEQHRRAAMKYNALMVDADDVAEIARCVDGVLSPS